MNKRTTIILIFLFALAIALAPSPVRVSNTLPLLSNGSERSIDHLIQS